MFLAHQKHFIQLFIIISYTSSRYWINKCISIGYRPRINKRKFQCAPQQKNKNTNKNKKCITGQGYKWKNTNSPAKLQPSNSPVTASPCIYSKYPWRSILLRVPSLNRSSCKTQYVATTQDNNTIQTHHSLSSSIPAMLTY